ncbi:MAG: D-alanyl-D-alanine carboxypeptidase [Clostridia bacterium]|nr:D-alanyl-D-alanine carboxypeptidase [Clostridia bacterium]
MITIEASSKRVLYFKDEHRRLPMASTTKILTAIVAIESGVDLDEKHVIQKEWTGVEGSSIYLQAGEILSLRELLYGLMLRSGNDAAVAIAGIVAGDVESFVSMMNDYVLKLGLKDTHIVTVNGLHDNNHYTTAYDLAIISAKAMENAIFAEISNTKSVKIANTKSKFDDKCRVLVNKNKFLKMIDSADGIKIGYTKKAGKCFVSSCTKNGMRIITVVLNSSDMFKHSKKLTEKAFEEFKLKKLLAKDANLGEVEIGDKKFSVFLQNDLIFPLKNNEISQIKGKIIFNKEIFDKTNSVNEALTFDLTNENNLIFSAKVYTISIEESKNGEDALKKIIEAF